MIEKKDISVVIQGPIDDRTYEAIDCYQDFAEVIVSNWIGEDITLLDKSSGKFTLAQSEYPEGKENICFNAFLAQTTMAGCLQVKTQYVLKTRSDELYPDLTKLLENLNKYPDRSHTTDNGFWRQFPFCYSNHLFIDKREHVAHAMQDILFYETGRKYQDLKDVFVCPESQFGYFLMKARGFDLSREDWKEIFRDNVFITPCVDLKGHLHSGQTSASKGFKRSSDPYPSGRMEIKDHTHDLNKLYQHIDQIK